MKHYTCAYCNGYKGSNVAGWLPDRQEVVRLFHPRRDDWSTHFAWSGPVVVAKTDIGRVTIEVLRLNSPAAVEVRQSLLELGHVLM
jgi:hypothetical protein